AWRHTGAVQGARCGPAPRSVDSGDQRARPEELQVMVRLVACAAVSGIFALLVGCSGEDSPSEPPVSTGGTVSTGGGSGGTLPTGGAPATGGTDPGPMVELEPPIERDGKYVL